MKIHFVSLGCDKNLVDSEVMLGILMERGYEITMQPEDAEILVVNTCCFIHDAKEESIQTILELAEYKKFGKAKLLIAAGCLAQRYQEDIRLEIPEVDALIGTTAFDEIAKVIDQALAKKGEIQTGFKDLNYLTDVKVRRTNTTGGYYSYLKIAEGCDKRCTYCIIPKIRGDYRSVPMDSLLKEAEMLAKDGVSELILVAQETTVYGVDLYGRKTLAALLTKLCGIEGIRWIRILYCYPEEIDEALLDVIAKEPKICKYLDIPVQHAADSVLQRMGRRTNRKELETVINLIRQKVPDVVLRTSLITGFPGETKEDHECLLDFVRQMKFERLGVFTYSREEDTPAAKMPEQVLKKVKDQRRKELMSVQQELAFKHAESLIGRVLDVQIEGRLPEEGVYVGRSYMDAPEVDGYLFITDQEEHLSGDFITIKVTGAKGYDLIGEVILKEGHV